MQAVPPCGGCYQLLTAAKAKKVPALWKTSCIVPMSKKGCHSATRLPRPTALCIPDWHRHGGYHHLPAGHRAQWGSGSSSAFNTVQPGRLVEKLSSDVGQAEPGDVDCRLPYRQATVRLWHCPSDVVTNNSGTAQGTVLSQFLFPLYTSEFCCDTQTCHLQKFTDCCWMFHRQ